jgi:hypothetical protein
MVERFESSSIYNLSPAVCETAEFLPPISQSKQESNSEEEKIAFNNTLRFYPNGLIDLESIFPIHSECQKDGLEYEELGMTLVDSLLPDDCVAIGSHLLDAVIKDTDLGIKGNGRPDVMVFNGTIKMYEFKRTLCEIHCSGLIRRKLIGISSLLNNLRNNPNVLSELINRFTGFDILPYPLKIPPDEEIEPVLFISSTKHSEEGIFYADGTSLRGAFKYLPYA